MYTSEKTYRDEKYKPRKNQNDMPSFSSTLLDEIYRSIDGKSDDLKPYKEKPAKKQSGIRAVAKANIIIEGNNDESASFRRACLVDKWMEKEKNDKSHHHVSKRRPNLEMENNDLVFFSSTSSSNSDSSGALSSSDTEFFGSQTKPKVSCFSTRPKPIRTGGENKKNLKEDCFLFDGYLNNHHNKNKMEDDDLIKHKSRALKIYANLKKVKQPISPGGRLTTFINSLFNNANGKKSKNVDTDKKIQDLKSPKAQSACSSASSFSRSCLSKYSPGSREKMRNGDQRTVRFHPVSVIVDEDSRPCGHKSILDDQVCDNKYAKPQLSTTLAELKVNTKMEKNRKIEEEVKNHGIKGYNNNNNNKKSDEFSVFRKINGGDDEDEDDDFDGMSDSSSDLFELDHLALFGNNRFCEELPVYETTHLDTNRVIASRLIR